MLSTFFVMLSGAVLCFILLLVLLSIRKTGIPGVQEWCVANALAIVAFTLYAFGRQLPPLLAYEAANGAYIAAILAVYVGYCRLLSQAVPWITIGGGLASAVGTIALWHYGNDSFTMRTGIVSLAYIMVCLAIAQAVFRARSTWTSRYAYGFSFVMALIVAVGHGARAVLQVTQPSAPTSLLEPTAWSLTVLCASTLVMPVLTLGPLMIVHSILMANSANAANRDFLTGAWTRRAFWEAAEREMARSRRNGSPLSLLVMDVDHFKSINDTFGHAEGDVVLKEMVLRVQAAMRNADYFGRIGGEEFAVLMPDTALLGAQAVAERLRVALAVPRLPSELPAARPSVTGYTVSIGTATLRDTDTFHEMMHRADDALYQAKASGRNRVVSELALDCAA